jgi:hypothetical protein
MMALFLLTALLIYLLLTRLSSSAPSPVGSSRLWIIALNLGALGWFYFLVVQTYSVRLRQLGMGPFPLNSWQNQARMLVLMAALPLCALALAVVIPPTQRAFEVVFPISIVGAFVSLGVCLWAFYP